MIRITDAAEKYFTQLLSKQEPGTQIRAFVTNPGTPNATYGISYCPPKTVKATDIELKFNKISIYIDQLSTPFLQDAEIDLIKNKFSSQITLKAINSQIGKINTEASLIERVEHWLQLQINPQLQGHGGEVKLIEITDDMLVILQFSGGCNGCSMVDYTLKEWIEKELTKNFPELKGVHDLTDHQHGKHSFY